MKDQYFGDINDYRKYGLLRLLCPPGGLSLGVVWMLTAADGRPDGGRITYLRQPEVFRGFDPALFDHLEEVVLCRQRRRVACAEQSGLFAGAKFINREFTDAAGERDATRPEWLAELAGRELVFFDPDNGLEVKSCPWGRRNSSKYLYWREVEATFERGHSLLIFQHFPRVNRARYTASALRKLQQRIGAAAVLAFETSLVVFLLAAQARHVGEIHARAEAVRLKWRGQMKVWGMRPGRQSR